MPTRHNRVDEAERRATVRLGEVLRDLRSARIEAGISQSVVATALGRSRSIVTKWERGEFIPDPIQLAQWGAVVGLDVVLRAYSGGSPLRDAAQLNLLRRARQAIGECWRWRTEVPVGADPMERRAFDAVISRGGTRIALEAVSRLVDAQAQIRAVSLKQEAAGLGCVVMILADTRHNRAALREAEPTLRAAFPERSRAILAALRGGTMPPANGVVLV